MSSLGVLPVLHRALDVRCLRALVAAAQQQNDRVPANRVVHAIAGADIDAHCERARKAGAEIMQEPDTQFYGDRTYRARDGEGHIWTFGVTVQEMTPAEWDKAMGGGVRTQTRL